MPKRRSGGAGLAVWRTARTDGPIVARANEATAARLGITLPELLEVAATLEVFAPHADGTPTYRCRDLLRALGQLPDSTETASHRGGRATRRRVEAATATAPRPAR